MTNSLISQVNSSTAPLGSGATFTGGWEKADQFPDVAVTLLTDNSGTLYFDFSHNGSTIQSTFPVAGFSITANQGFFHTAVKLARYFRVRLVNDAGTQSSLSLQTEFGYIRQGNLPINATIGNDADATVVRIVDSNLDISAGRFSGFYPVNKFGRASDGMQTTATDIWDRADSVPTQQIWTAPTQARVHAIVSDDANDDVDSGTGARTIKVYGLTNWSTRETSETIEMQGLTPVNTANSYVIIHRMRVVTKGGSGPNVGTITATAATDGTITAAILPGRGSTEMAVYGWPSIQTLYVKNWKTSLNKSSGTASHAEFSLIYNPEPDVELTGFIVQDITGRQSNGTSSAVNLFDPFLPLSGPGIVKIQAIASVADVDGDAGFGAILVDN